MKLEEKGLLVIGLGDIVVGTLLLNDFIVSCFYHGDSYFLHFVFLMLPGLSWIIVGFKTIKCDAISRISNNCLAVVGLVVCKVSLLILRSQEGRLPEGTELANGKILIVPNPDYSMEKIIYTSCIYFFIWTLIYVNISSVVRCLKK